MRRNLLPALLVVALALAGGKALAAASDTTRPPSFEEWSGNVAAVTDYRFRGVSQTSSNPALQGGGDWVYNELIYAGTWVSNVDFNDGSNAKLEWDIYGGVRPKLGPVTLDLGFRQFVYPGSKSERQLNYLDFVAGIGYQAGDASISGNLDYSRDNNGGTGESFYWSADLYWPAWGNLRASAHLGYQSIEDNARAGLDDYATWTLELGYTYERIEIFAAYVDTTLERRQCGDDCAARLVLGIYKGF